MDGSSKLTLGEKLARCIKKANRHGVKHKGRARLVQKTPERRRSKERIVADVMPFVSNIGRLREPFTNPRYLVERLEELADLAEVGQMTIDEVPEAIWAAIAVEGPNPYFSSIEGQRELARLMRQHAESERQSPGYKFTPVRGRKTDWVLISFLTALACVYEEYTGFRATATEAKDGSGMCSPFFKFVTTILRHFSEEPRFAHWLEHNGTLNDAIQHVASAQGHDDFDIEEHGYIFSE